jgi:hypothetical protein
MRNLKAFSREKRRRRSIKDLEALLPCHDTYRAENLAVISSVLVCNVTSKERKRESEELGSKYRVPR